MTEEAAARAIALHPMANAYHEAGHGVVGLVLGAHPLRRLVLFEEGADAAPEGAPKYGGQAQFGEGGREQHETICACWRINLMRGALTCAGTAAERRFRLAERLPQMSLFLAQSDRSDMRALALAVWQGAGRYGLAFERLAWRTSQRIVDEPRIWAAIEVVAQALLHAPLQDGERALSGECVKAIMREAGVEPGALRQAFLLAALRQRAARETAKPHAGLRCWRHGGRWSILFPPPPPTAATESKSPALKAPAAPGLHPHSNHRRLLVDIEDIFIAP